jgi:predicted amidohydrolase
VRVVLVQTDCVLGDTEANLRRAKDVIEENRPAMLVRESNRLAEEGGDL